MKKLSLICLSAGFSALVFSSCNTTTSPVRSSGGGIAAYQAYDLPTKRPSNPRNVRVKVSTSNQMVYVMEGRTPLMIMPVSVGTSKTPTPKGNFRIFKKKHYKRANSHGYAYSGGAIKKTYLSKKPAGWSFKGTPMPYWSEFKTNYGFHTGWVKPYPCTHGCIRMHENAAPKFYSLISVGTPVNIATTQPEDATIGRNVRRPVDAGPLPDYAPNFYLGEGYFTRHKAPTYN